MNSNAMKIQDFEKELQQLNKDITIKSSPTKGLAGIYLSGSFVFSIPDGDIFDEPNENYSVETLSGQSIRHRTRPEATEMLKAKLQQLEKDPDYEDAFYGRGQYSDANLK